MANDGKGTTKAHDVFDSLEVGGDAPAEAKAGKNEKTTTEAAEPKPKVAKYRSKRTKFFACVRTRSIIRDGNGRTISETPAKNVQFENGQLATNDPEVIEWLERYIHDSNTPTDEVFRMPEIDPLITSGFSNRIDSMGLDELRSVCRERGIDILTVDDENALKYKLLKHLTGFGKKP